VTPRIGFTTYYQIKYFEVGISTFYEYMKGDTNVENGVVGVVWVTQGQ